MPTCDHIRFHRDEANHELRKLCPQEPNDVEATNEEVQVCILLALETLSGYYMVQRDILDDHQEHVSKSDTGRRPEFFNRHVGVPTFFVHVLVELSVLSG